jgi:hypothetical protein
MANPSSPPSCTDTTPTRAEAEDQPIGPPQEFIREIRATVTGTRLVAQFVPVQAHQCGFRARKERGKEKKDNKQADQVQQDSHVLSRI